MRIHLFLFTLSFTLFYLSGHAFQISSCRRRVLLRRPYSCSSPSSTAAAAATSSPLTILYSKENGHFDDEASRSTPLASSSTQTDDDDDVDQNHHRHNLLVDKRGEARRRRYFLQMMCSISSIFPFITSSDDFSHIASALAADYEITSNDDDNSIRRLLPKMVTNTIYMDVRISRADGTFYVRDNETGNDEDPFYGRLVIGLFGKRTPNHVQQFMKYVTVGEESYDVNNPLPSYSTSKFPLLDTSSGLLIGGKIPGLEATTLAGGTVLEYAGRVLPAKLWLEDTKGQLSPNDDSSADTIALSHSIVGLLTHRNLDLTPTFGITTRRGPSLSSSTLDATHTIFGCILEDTNGFLEKIVDLPVLTDTGMVSMTTTTNTAMNTNDPATGGSKGDMSSRASVVDRGVSSLASSVFTVQRKVFRDAAKTFGDTRLDKVYDGKILRRIEVTKVGILRN